jgi:hypothetical protein
MRRRPERHDQERQTRGDRRAESREGWVEESKDHRERLAQIVKEHPWAIGILLTDRAAGSPSEFARAVIVVRTMLVAKLGVTPPQVEALIAAPRDPVYPAQIEQWRLVDSGEGTHLLGRVTGHPRVIDGHCALSTCIIGGPTERGLVLTLSGQLYRLGRRGRSRAPSGETPDPWGPAGAGRVH